MSSSQHGSCDLRVPLQGHADVISAPEAPVKIEYQVDGQSWQEENMAGMSMEDFAEATCLVRSLNEKRRSDFENDSGVRILCKTSVEAEIISMGMSPRTQNGWDAAETLDQSRVQIQARLCHVINNFALSVEVRKTIAHKLWHWLGAWDSRSIILNQQVDPNNTGVTEEGVAIAKCPACSEKLKIESDSWGEEAKRRLRQRSQHHLNEVRTSVLCKRCSGHGEPSKFLCNTCNVRKPKEFFTTTQISKQLQKRMCIECQHMQNPTLRADAEVVDEGPVFA